VNIRKFVVRAGTLDELVGLGTLTASAASCLDACVVAGLNVLVITCEEVFELKVPLPDVVRMQTRQPNLEGIGEISLRHLHPRLLRLTPPMSHPLRLRAAHRCGW
jgi:pilus assembly protein CpaF